MATASLLKTSCSFFVHRDSTRPPVALKVRNPILLPPTTQIPPPLLPVPSIKMISTVVTTGFSMQCVMNNSKNCFIEEEEDEDRKRNKKKSLNKRFAEVMMLSGVLFLAYDPYSSLAIAASGGRMGGQSFSSSSSSSSSSSPSSSYSSSSYSPSTSYSSSSSSPSFPSYYSSSSSSPSYYSSSSSSSNGYSFSSSSSPSFSFSISSPTYHLISIGQSWSKFASEWSLFLSVISVIALILISVYDQAFQPPTLDRSKGSSSTLTNPQTTTVLKLQVGLMGMKQLLQRNLDRIAETADTSTIKGLSNILRDTTSLLLQHPDCCISSYSSVDVKQSIDDGEKLFNKLCIEERGKFDEETLVNVDNSKRHKTSSKGANGGSNEYLVITILVAAKGVHKLPAINGSADLKEALQKLYSISSNKTMAALEVLWTPQKENDTLTEQELREDYPLLRSLYKDQDT